MKGWEQRVVHILNSGCRVGHWGGGEKVESVLEEFERYSPVLGEAIMLHCGPWHEFGAV